MSAPGIETMNVVAAFFGAIAAYLRKRKKTFWGGVVSVITGTACSVFLTPALGTTAGIDNPDQLLGLSFLLGTVGMNVVDAAFRKLVPGFLVETDGR